MKTHLDISNVSFSLNGTFENEEEAALFSKVINQHHKIIDGLSMILQQAELSKDNASCLRALLFKIEIQIGLATDIVSDCINVIDGSKSASDVGFPEFDRNSKMYENDR